MSTQTFHPQASLHLGCILFRDSETPVGVNAYGLTLEDACYALENEGTQAMQAFQREVFASLKQGKTLGTFRGESWRYVGATSCHESDTLNA
jgi:hypothetical protein